MLIQYNNNNYAEVIALISQHPTVLLVVLLNLSRLLLAITKV
jgi:hypothetical protein